MRPNLFSFATSELSHDALICWILSWADSSFESSHSALNEFATKFLKICAPVYSDIWIGKKKSVRIVRQSGKIDVLCIINDEFAIVIEDKVGSSHHSNQLARYKEYAQKVLGFKLEKIALVYLQTGDESCYSEPNGHGYTIVSRPDILELLESSIGLSAIAVSDILDDYCVYLRERQSGFKSYEWLPLGEWTSHSWKGFFSELQAKIGDGKWNYVANPSGGFMGFYWFFRDCADCTVYVQLEEGKFCFKIDVTESDLQRIKRGEWSKLIVDFAHQKNLPIDRPSRFGRGRWMTVAVVVDDYRVTDEHGILNFNATFEFIQSMQLFLEELHAKVHPKL